MAGILNLPEGVDEILAALLTLSALVNVYEFLKRVQAGDFA
ncbi:hypothetical protein [Haloarcula sp. Atlit-47R]|nr:hypothetical protein [Haloarcula sp. Atlit-47R]